MAASSSERSTTVVESHTLLDVPDDVAEQLHAWLAGGANADVRLAVEEDKNVATLKVNGHSLSAAFTTLPTVVETHASLDGVTFYKSGEVGKMLVARHSPDDLPRVVTGEVPSAPADAELMPEQPDGLTAPTANIRKKMWRKRPPRDPKDVEQVAIELEALRGGSLKPEFELVTRRETRTDFRAQAQAELTQIDPQIAKFRKMATNVSNPDQRRQIQAKIQALEKQRAAVLARAQGS